MLQKLSPMLQIGFFTYIFLLKTLKSIIKPYFVKKPTEIIRHNESFHKFAFNRKHIL